MTTPEIAAIDREHIWHPYATVPASTAPFVVHAASGCRLDVTVDGERHQLIDAMSSWWAAIHGYNHPALNRAITDQLSKMSHVMFGGLTHEPAAQLAQRLVQLTPRGLDRVFFCDSGSVSVEVALKMALQFWQSTGHPDKCRFMTWRGGYHGDTFHPMSVCDPDGGMHEHWSSVLPEQIFVPAPPSGFDQPVDPEYVAVVRATLAEHARETAAIIIEPVVQGAGRMDWHAPGYLTMWRELADEFDVLLIFDEIATGFGRTGAMFAADHAGVSPDIMCVGKALTGGYVTMAAALCTAAVADGIASGALPVLAHGPTFMANPLAAAVATASIDELLGQDWASRVADMSTRLSRALGPTAEVPGVVDVRVLGAIGAVEMAHEVDVATATRAAISEGVWIRPFRNLIYTMPPFICDGHDIETIGRAMTVAAVAAARPVGEGGRSAAGSAAPGPGSEPAHNQRVPTM